VTEHWTALELLRPAQTCLSNEPSLFCMDDSNKMEAMVPLPVPFTDNRLWWRASRYNRKPAGYCSDQRVPRAM